MGRKKKTELPHTEFQFPKEDLYYKVARQFLPFLSMLAGKVDGYCFPMETGKTIS
jgi:hypothetical protein